MSYSREVPSDVDVGRLRFPWKTVVALVCAVATILLSVKAAEMAAGRELADVKTRVSVSESKQEYTEQQLERLQRLIDRLETAVDRLQERGR